MRKALIAIFGIMAAQTSFAQEIQCDLDYYVNNVKHSEHYQAKVGTDLTSFLSEKPLLVTKNVDLLVYFRPTLNEFEVYVNGIGAETQTDGSKPVAVSIPKANAIIDPMVDYLRASCQVN